MKMINQPYGGFCARLVQEGSILYSSDDHSYYNRFKRCQEVMPMNSNGPFSVAYSIFIYSSCIIVLFHDSDLPRGYKYFCFILRRVFKMFQNRLSEVLKIYSLKCYMRIFPQDTRYRSLLYSLYYITVH